MRDLRAMNILPDTLVRQTVVAGRDPASYAAYGDLNAAGGGYDFLLQATNNMVTEAAFSSLKLNWLAGQLDAQAIAALQASGAAPASAQLQAAINAAGTAGGGTDLLILFTQKDVLFDTQTTCKVRADVQLALGRFLRVPREPGLGHTPSRGETVEQVGVAVSRIVQEAARELAQVVRSLTAFPATAAPMPLRAEQMAPPTMQFAGGTLADWRGNIQDRVAIDTSGRYLPTHLDLGDRTSFDVTAWLGGGVLEVPAPFAATGNQTAATIHVAADVHASSPQFTNLSHDAALLLSPTDPAGLVALTTHRVRERGQVTLLDDISLVGGLSTTRVNNLAQLSPAAFPCGQGASPLSVGAGIVAWHVGTPTAIRFVGETGYGVLWSAEAVSLLINYCWDTRRFPRTVTQTTTVKLTVNGHDQDASAESDVQLQSLKTVTLEYDANGRTDLLHFGGNAQVIPRRIRLADGSEVLPKDPHDPLFAPGAVRPWNAIGTLTEDLPAGGAPDIVQFERAITNGVTSRLGRPFTETVDRTVTFSRISGYAQRIVLLAE